MDMSTDAVWELFSLFNFSVQLSYDRLSFDGGVLTNVSDIVFFFMSYTLAQGSDFYFVYTAVRHLYNI